MARILLLYVAILLTGTEYIVDTTTTCIVMDKISNCRYTVSCEFHAGSATNYDCDYEPYVTFEITNSKTDMLSAGFFGATNFDARIRIFKAINNTWKVISAGALRYYSKTIEMNLSGNQIQEIHNEAFINLFRLKSLNLSSNAIESLNYKSILTGEIGQSEIEILDLSNNVLKVIANEALYHCSNLQELYLENNNIGYLEDNIFSKLQNLTVLYLQNNKLTELNMTLINLKQLKVLDLSHNAIPKLSGYETNRMTSLERVNASYNKIEFIESNCFNQAFNLESLDLRYNKITSTISNIMFINNGKLNYLNLYNNVITKIQENSFQHNMLQYLNLEMNFISGEITETSFAGLQRIKYLNLFNQNITSIKANAFKEMTSLVNLTLSANNIDSIDQLSFNNTISLNILDLSRNTIECINFFKGFLTNLTEIYLNNNRITVIPALTFINQTRVKKLDISNNKIITIEKYSLPLNNLQFFNISGNPLNGTLKNNVLSPAQYLRYLDLSKLNITRIENLALTDLPVLSRLNLSHNAIEFIGSNNFLNMSNMFSLDLSYNRLSNLQLNGTSMSSLSAFYVNNNNFSTVTGIIPNSTEITYFDISYNNIEELTGAAFETLKNLVVLRASSNKIKTFNNPQINNLTKLKDIDLSSNQISQLDLRFYKDLVRVDISNNNINYINRNFLQNLNVLQVLNMCNNNISELPPGLFQSTNILKLLNISSNNLSNLRYGSLRGLHNIQVLDISRNKITDMDVEMFHECKELMRIIIDYNLIRNLDVEELINVAPNLVSLSIGGNPLDCKQIVRHIRNINKTTERFVKITSIDNTFHEDNVHGIKCGDVISSTTSATLINVTVPPTLSNSSALFIWCSALTVLLVLVTVIFFIWKRYYVSSGMYGQSRMQLGRSVELSGSEFQSDLLN